MGLIHVVEVWLTTVMLIPAVVEKCHTKNLVNNNSLYMVLSYSLM